MRYNKDFFSPKFKSGGLRYEVGVCIATGNIVWIHGPFRGGKNDISISQAGILRGPLEEGEMCEADNGYQGEDVFIKTPAGFHIRSNKEKGVESNAGSCHESVNGRMKDSFRAFFVRPVPHRAKTPELLSPSYLLVECLYQESIYVYTIPNPAPPSRRTIK